jgi:16S rRNA (adenine1518-N6/adenine1519-N6)-dimethyltransferase
VEHRARKRFGQNFLTDSTIIDRIVMAINPGIDDHLIEIGPGLGALTCPLIKQTGKLDVIELDRDIIPKLRLNCGLQGELNIHNVDVLKYDFSELYDGEHKLRIVGNLPYNISTPIIFHLVKYADMIRDMHFMLQKEVVQRLAAAAGTADYSRLSVMAQLHFRVTPLFLVPPEAFNPRPKVESAIVKLVPHSEPPVQIDDRQVFDRLISQAFSQRRKTIRNVLKKICTEAQLEEADIDPGHRTETIDLQRFARLANILSQDTNQNVHKN